MTYEDMTFNGIEKSQPNSSFLKLFVSINLRKKGKSNLLRTVHLKPEIVCFNQPFVVAIS